ncbi:Superoxide dismutase [Dorcoceras hygrometricum]|uniref:Superoxide dismutase n=1 Tax=Dorcoceras hygrometricum TaxID=472368 RepID=A0A2Z7BJX8_9LAMI|nr:Superoxide dismutase [Dorcoceras hygrometricum]
MALRSLTRHTLRNATLGFRGLQTFSLPDLPYDYGALEPAISGEIMQLHHQKHHQTYITNYNKALEQLDAAVSKGDASTVVKLQSAIKFNGEEGGGEPPKGSLGSAIDSNFGSLEALIQKINAEGAALQGSGWVWLAADKELKRLVIETTLNQDPLVTKGPSLVPLLGIDVWEHAYYLQYKNVRPDYLKNIWKVINWKYASEVYDKEFP